MLFVFMINCLFVVVCGRPFVASLGSAWRSRSEHTLKVPFSLG